MIRDIHLAISISVENLSNLNLLLSQLNEAVHILSDGIVSTMFEFTTEYHQTWLVIPLNDLGISVTSC